MTLRTSRDRSVVVVGAGIVGLATALALNDRYPSLRLTVIDKEQQPGTHQTAHNSGVIHSGIYYRPGSLKATLCIEGGRRLRRFCVEHGVPFETCGKLVVATTEGEIPFLETLRERGSANGVEGIRRLSRTELREIEPHAAGLEALYSPGTAIVDYGRVAREMAHELARRSVSFVYGAKVHAIERRTSTLAISTSRESVEADYLVNCAGLHADYVARLAGAPPTVAIVPFRGEYYMLRPESRHLVRGLIYPVPDPAFPFLGVHFTRTIDGGVEAGPNAVLAFAREGYGWGRVNVREFSDNLREPGFWRMAKRYWRTGGYEFFRSLNVRAFVASLQKLVPEIRESDVVRNGAGVRAQAVTRDGRLADDFVIVNSPHAVHVLNAPSPAATASLAIGDHVGAIVGKTFELD